jgi:hypothetical protein
MSTDGGKTFAKPTTIFAQAAPIPAHVQLAVKGTRVIATWDAMRAYGATVEIRVSNNGGAHFSGPLTLSDTTQSSQYPVVGMTRNVAYVAWSQTTAEGHVGPMGHQEHPAHGQMMKMGLQPVGETQVMLREVQLQ